jgi:hypothetical protein
MNRRRFLQLLCMLPFVRLPTLEFNDKAIMMVGDWDAGDVVFVSEDGDDANDGLSPETAKRTLASAFLVNTGPWDDYRYYPSAVIGQYEEETNHADA